MSSHAVGGADGSSGTVSTTIGRRCDAPTGGRPRPGRARDATRPSASTPTEAFGLHRELRLRRIAHDDAGLGRRRHALVPNGVDEIDIGPTCAMSMEADPAIRNRPPRARSRRDRGRALVASRAPPRPRWARRRGRGARRTERVLDTEVIVGRQQDVLHPAGHTNRQRQRPEAGAAAVRHEPVSLRLGIRVVGRVPRGAQKPGTGYLAGGVARANGRRRASTPSIRSTTRAPARAPRRSGSG